MTRNKVKIDRLKRKLEGLKDTPRGMAGSAGRRLESQVVPKMQRRIINHDAVASTELFRSFTVSGPTAQDFGNWSVRLTNYAPHAVYVEFGTGGFEGPSYPSDALTKNFAAPPLSPHLVAEIRKWMVMKPSFVTDDIEVSGVASAIATAIAFGGKDRFGNPRPAGTPAQPFFFNTWFEEELQFRKFMRRVFKAKIKREMAG